MKLPAVLIVCPSLLGLAALVVRQRAKEIDIRKILGASVGNVVLLLSKDFVKLVLMANFFACPVAWWAMNPTDIALISLVSFIRWQRFIG